ncbi:hypothetical protein ABT040_35610 [Streptomyces sp. NPDC002688]|uniref:YncE family protein n=1 Tax=Streptomyces sp. NPDC002688 TaxID=3154423 RepID=UPI003330127A
MTGFQSRTVTVIDALTRTVDAVVPVGPFPADLGVSPDGQRLYVSLQEADAIAVLDVGTLKVRRRLPLGAPPFGLALTPDGLRGYATARDMDFLLPFDTRVVSAPMPSRPEAVAAHADGRRVYVTASGDDKVAVVGPRERQIDAGPGPNAVRLTPDGRHVYVANTGAGTVTVLDTRTDDVLETIQVGVDVFALAVPRTAGTCTSSGPERCPRSTPPPARSPVPRPCRPTPRTSRCRVTAAAST